VKLQAPQSFAAQVFRKGRSAPQFRTNPGKKARWLSRAKDRHGHTEACVETYCRKGHSGRISVLSPFQTKPAAQIDSWPATLKVGGVCNR
jgi:hypothetical protein